MSDVPTSVRRSLADVPVSGATCLEAGTGVGNVTAHLAASGASAVYSVSNEREHLDRARERVDAPGVALLEADLTCLPLEAGAVDLVTAHGLVNVVPPSELAAVTTELTRVAAAGGQLVVNDYGRPPAAGERSTPVERLFAVENAAARLADGRPALTFYPAAHLRALLVGLGWEHVGTDLLTSEVPWDRALLEAHLGVVERLAAEVDPPLDEALEDAAREAVAAVEEGAVVHAGTMYSLRMRLPRDSAP